VRPRKIQLELVRVLTPQPQLLLADALRVVEQLGERAGAASSPRKPPVGVDGHLGVKSANASMPPGIEALVEVTPAVLMATRRSTSAGGN